MPIYEFECNSCNEKFEELVFGKREVSCPKCKSVDLRKLFSTFAVSGSSKPVSSVPSCGTCKPATSKCSTCH